VKSLDYAPRKVSTTPLDLISLDERENPVERSLMNALTALQALKYMGADVSDLVTWLEEHWGMDYLHDLVEKVGFASADDISSFIASGGRPTPQIYMSANLLTQFRIESRPTVDVGSLLNISAFMTRYVVVARFVAVVHSLVHGIQAPYSWTFHCNESQLSRTYKNTFQGVKLRLSKRASISPLAGQVSDAADYASFLAARIPTKHLDKADRVDAYLAVNKILDSLPRADTNTKFSGGPSFFTNRVPKPKPSRPVVSKDIHSKVTTILFGYSSDARGHESILDSYGICIAEAAMQILDPEGDLRAEMVSRATSIMGMNRLKRYINIAEARKSIVELNVLCTGRDPSVTTFYYLQYRYLSLSAPNADLAINAALDAAQSKVTSNKYATTYGFRGIRYYMDFLAQHVEGKQGLGHPTRPFIYLRNQSGLMNKSSLAISLFTENFRDMLEKDVSARKNARDKTAKEAQRLMIAPVFSKLRRSWSEFYATKAAACRQALSLVDYMATSTGMKAEYVSILREYLETEAIHNIALALAYKFYSIQLSETFDIEKSSTENYRSTKVKRCSQHY
jgi:hypothetical protein